MEIMTLLKGSGSSATNPYWELCYTMNDSWGYQPYDKNYKTPNMIVRTLADVISMGGNLFDIGPKSDGTIPEEQIEILKNLGRWTSKNQHAIYETTQEFLLTITKENHLCQPLKNLYFFILMKPKVLQRSMDWQQNLFQ
jgi:alpha-L-fucosidase